ncbi:hypothetical protein [Saccharopolyspora griseoalba]|uniref:Uncharacterized protein n=1 Tax=Saccharopolyspora griseoalba TaxID=1431848 RepID=A0ABW2LNM1_9PSEU
MLEQKIRERRQTLEEFVASAEQFARENGEAGTLGMRHLQRLVSGRGPNGRPLGPVRPATARLLEHMLDTSVEELLAPTTPAEPGGDSTSELLQMLHLSRKVDEGVVRLLRDQLTAIRHLDRQLGAVIAHEEVCMKAEQVSAFLSHSPPGEVRAQLATLLSELRTLAGWQALDLGCPVKSWQHYETAKRAARESENEAFEIHTTGEQSFVLLDIGETTQAVELLAAARSRAATKVPKVLRAWLEAARGEALASDGQLVKSLQAFDTADSLLSQSSYSVGGPYIALNHTHLARWRGHALAQLRVPGALDVLSSSLRDLDPSFVRATTALRVDLATAHSTAGDRENAAHEMNKANELARSIGSKRQQRRIAALQN